MESYVCTSQTSLLPRPKICFAYTVYGMLSMISRLHILNFKKEYTTQHALNLLRVNSKITKQRTHESVGFTFI